MPKVHDGVATANGQDPRRGAAVRAGEALIRGRSRPYSRAPVPTRQTALRRPGRRCRSAPSMRGARRRRTVLALAGPVRAASRRSRRPRSLPGRCLPTRRRDRRRWRCARDRTGAVGQHLVVGLRQTGRACRRDHQVGEAGAGTDFQLVVGRRLPAWRIPVDLQMARSYETGRALGDPVLTFVAATVAKASGEFVLCICAFLGRTRA